MSNNIENKVFINVIVEDGYNADGDIIHKLVPLPDINPNTFNAQKVLNIVEALKKCLTQPVAGVHKIQGKSLIVLA